MKESLKCLRPAHRIIWIGTRSFNVEYPCMTCENCHKIFSDFPQFLKFNKEALIKEVEKCEDADTAAVE